MNELDQSRHPDAEALAAFVDGALTGSEIGSVAGHLRECTECREAVAETARFQRENGEADVVPIVSMKPRQAARRWGWLAAAAAIVVVSIPIINRMRDPMNAVQGVHRGTEGRLIGLDYADYAALRGGNDEDPSATSKATSKQLGAAARLQEKVEQQRTAANLDRFARAELSIQQPQHALELLNEAARLDPNNAEILSDLSAAQSASSKFAAAVESADRALKINPSLAAAAFNRAVALSNLPDSAAAHAAWESYLKLDSTSRWADEARTHLTE